MSPTQRTLKYYRDLGCIAEVVEHYNYFSKRRVDLFGFVDIIVIDEDGFKFIQCTSGSNVKARYNKIVNENIDTVDKIKKAKGEVLVVGWRKLKKKRGGKQMVWQPRIIKV